MINIIVPISIKFPPYSKCMCRPSTHAIHLRNVLTNTTRVESANCRLLETVEQITFTHFFFHIQIASKKKKKDTLQKT